MRNHTGPLRVSGLFSRPRTAVAVTAVAALTTLGLGAPLPATSAVDTSCPAPFPVPGLVDGQQVHGLTVSKGTTPEPFTGEVLGVIDDGIAPDFDMIVARLTSPEIDRVGGIWQGMSGSPVYAADGRLIGAVSYGLSWGSSPVAGITPAEEMQDLLTVAPGDTSARSAPTPEAKVAVPPRLQRELVSSGAASGAEAESGMSRLRLPLGISGMITGKRLKQVVKALDIDDVRAYKTGAVSAAAAPEVDIVAGGNLAASVSYGDLSTIGVGTATAICGEEVLGFGHPMSFSGPSTLTMHGAKVIYVQEDSLGAPFKVANATGPVGSIVQDRLAGLLGFTGAIPETADVTSYVEVPGERSRTGTTKISVPAAVPDIAAFHLLVDQDRIFDGVTGGRAEVGWTVTGRRADGSSFSYSRNDRFANTYDISFEPVWDLLDQLYRVQYNQLEKVTIQSVRTRSVMRRDFQSYTLKRVQVRADGAWRALSQQRVLRVRPGTTKRFRVILTSAELGTKKMVLRVPVPLRAGGKSGYLEFAGGNSFFGGGEMEGPGGEQAAPASFEQLLRQLATAPRNDHVLANLYFFTRNATLKRSVRAQAGAVVNGGFAVEVVGLRRR